jgi:hypothetical protein
MLVFLSVLNLALEEFQGQYTPNQVGVEKSYLFQARAVVRNFCLRPASLKITHHGTLALAGFALALRGPGAALDPGQ